ncbi:MAG: hypothetical protein AAGM67_00330, partial [Bacteroidota bacterium]
MATRRSTRSSAERESDEEEDSQSVEAGESGSLESDLKNRLGSALFERLPSDIWEKLGMDEIEDLAFLNDEALKEIGLPPILRRKLLQRVQVGAPTDVKLFERMRPKPSFEAFRGDSGSWPAWKRMTLAAFGQLGLRGALTSDEPISDESNAYIFSVLEAQLAKGSARARLRAHRSSHDGVAAFKSLNDWFDGAESSSKSPSDLRLDLYKSSLATLGSASKLINLFEEHLEDLLELGEPLPEPQACELLINALDSEDFEQLRTNFEDERVEKRWILEDLIKRLRRRERTLIQTGKRNPNGTNKLRQVKTAKRGKSHRFNPRARNAERQLRGERGEHENKLSENKNVHWKKDIEQDENKRDEKPPPKIEFPRNRNKNRRVKIRQGKLSQLNPEMKFSKLVLDSGAMQSVVNKDWRILSWRSCPHEVQAFDGSRVPIDRIVTAAAKYSFSDAREVILIVHEAHLVDHAEESLINPHALREANHVVSDVFMRHGGEQQITLENGMELALLESNSLELFLQISTPTAEDMMNLQIELVLNLPLQKEHRSVSRFYLGGITEETISFWMSRLCLNKQATKKTLASSTIYAVVQQDGRLRKHYKPRFPALSVTKLNTTIWTDTAFPQGGIQSIRGFNAFQVFYGGDGYISVYPMRSREKYFEVLQDFVRNEGAPLNIISDNAPEMESASVRKFLARIQIRQGTSEPYFPHQNRAERAIQHLKAIGVQLMKFAPSNLWCFAIQCAAAISNVQARKFLNWRTPYEKRWGTTPDISHLQLKFYDKVWYYAPEMNFPEAREKLGRILGPAVNTGDALCFHILTST